MTKPLPSRKVLVQIRLTTEERAAIRKAAYARRMTVSGYFRACALSYTISLGATK